MRSAPRSPAPRPHWTSRAASVVLAAAAVVVGVTLGRHGPATSPVSPPPPPAASAATARAPAVT